MEHTRSPFERAKTYAQTQFPAEVVRAGLDALSKIAEDADNPLWGGPSLGDSEIVATVGRNSEGWYVDSLEEFLAEYRSEADFAELHRHNRRFRYWLRFEYPDTRLQLGAERREQVESVFSVFDEAAGSSRIPVSEATVFIGHGRSEHCTALRDHLRDLHGYEVVAYETGARAGHSIRDILDEMLERSSFAVLVLTGEDETAAGSLRARQNVIHEAGLF